MVRKFGVSLNALYFRHVAGNTIAFAIDAAYCDWARGWLAGCALNVARQAFGIIKCGRRFNVVMRGMAGQAVKSTVAPRLIYGRVVNNLAVVNDATIPIAGEEGQSPASPWNDVPSPARSDLDDNMDRTDPAGPGGTL